MNKYFKLCALLPRQLPSVMMCWVLIYDYEQESETVFKNKETDKEKMPKLAKGLLLSVMEKFMAEILDSLVEASEPSDGVIRVITDNNLL